MSRFGIVGLLVAMAMIGGIIVSGGQSPANAQFLDPSLLDRFEEISGDRRSVTNRSPVDRSRERTTRSGESQDWSMENDRNEETGPKTYSPLEEDYQRRSDALLEQYGYDIFDGWISQSDVVTGRVPDNYILGVGDEVVVTLHGASQRSETVPVDREGRLVFTDLPPVNAAGRSFAEVKAEIREKARRAIIGTEAFVSVGALRLISVYVVGEVKRPGQYRMTSMASVLEALNAAGGVRKTGTLRRIHVRRGDTVESVDLYELTSAAGGGDLSLRDGDRIIVPTIGATAAVTGAVVRPGIYELGGATSARQLLELAGGSLRPSGYGLLLNRIDTSGRQVLDTVEDTAGRVNSGDILSIYNRSGGSSGVIEVLGHVRSPGQRSLAKVRTLRELLPDTGMIKDYPYLLFGVIERTDPVTQAQVFKPFSPVKVLMGEQDHRLHNRDKVIFLGRDDVDFLSSPMTREVILTGQFEREDWADELTRDRAGEVRRCRPLEQLARIVADTRSERFATTIRAVFTQVDPTRATGRGLSEEEARQAATRDRERERLSDREMAMMGQDPASLSGMRDRELEMEQFRARAREQEQQEDELFHIRDKENPNCPSVYQTVDSLLPFVLEYVASADGSVRRPGVYPIVDETPVSALAAVAGGTTANVDLTNVELLRFDARPEQGDVDFRRENLNASDVNLSRLHINPGSGVRFNALFVEQESGGVLLSGEFRNPGVYNIRRGEKLSELIERAGGLTAQAYPYGTVFTRERVRKAQQEGFKRTERELNMGLATAALKQRELSADSLLAAQQLAARIANTEAVGRVVTEADPRMLAGRPEADTVLEPGDQVHMPKRPNYVLILGDVLNPGAVQFEPGKAVESYLAEAGGVQRTADKGRVFVVLPNGVARPVRMSSWSRSDDVMVPPGTSIIVPKDVEPIDTLMLVRDLTAIISQLAVSAASIAVITR